MHDNVTQDFDRVSDLNDNGLNPLQGQQDEQPEGVNRPGNAIDNDVVDIMTLYPPWSLDTNNRCDNNQVASNRHRQEMQDELYKDMPVKTVNNKPYIDNIDAYNRDRALIAESLRQIYSIITTGITKPILVFTQSYHNQKLSNIFRNGC